MLPRGRGNTSPAPPEFPVSTTRLGIAFEMKGLPATVAVTDRRGPEGCMTDEQDPHDAARQG
ncbi:hypothetical protein CO709_27165 [Burkholderia thailandensis]|nr:hypothetical protein CO709_27165 [Burkholderia thailandensis]KST73983.1 hypothetical protein WS76_07300 [Burkholderia humptydooensis]